MATFDLTREGWLPCVREGRAVSVGLEGALLGAHTIDELYDPSPLVTTALHRLLLAILHRVLDGPRDMDAWAELWSAGRLPEERLRAYFARWRDRFDLFSETRPFFQSTAFQDEKPSPIQQLVHEAATGNNATLFDHTAARTGIAPDAAARYLVTIQDYALAGGNSQPFYFVDAPIARGYTVRAQGATLFETLLLNALVYNTDRPFARSGEDLPAWEQEQPAEPKREGTRPRGYVDYLTFQPRRVRLIECDGLVHEMLYRQNLVVLPEILDPFKAYFVRDEKVGWQHRLLNPDRAIWRDSAAIFAPSDAKPQSSVKAMRGEPAGELRWKRPLLFDHLAEIGELRRNGAITAAAVYPLVVAGAALVPQKSTVLLWRQERQPLPLAYLEEGDDGEKLRGALKGALDTAEAVATALDRRMWTLASYVLAPAQDASADAAKPDRDAVTRLRNGFRPGLHFWQRLDDVFSPFLEALAEPSFDEYGETVFGATALPRWRGDVRRAAEEAYAEATSELVETPRAFKAVAVAERGLIYDLRRLLGERDVAAEIEQEQKEVTA